VLTWTKVDEGGEGGTITCRHVL